MLESVDICILGRVMYPNYEQYWMAVLANPAGPLPLSGKPATENGIKYAEWANKTPHLVVSKTLDKSCMENVAHRSRHRRNREIETASREKHVCRRRCNSCRQLDEHESDRRSPADGLSTCARWWQSIVQRCEEPTGIEIGTGEPAEIGQGKSYLQH